MNALRLRAWAVAAMLALTLVAAAQNARSIINGEVTADTGEPVAFATISIANTSIGTTTDFDGHFTLSLPEGEHTLTIQAIGYQKQEVKATADSPSALRVTLMTEIHELDDVVVTSSGVGRLQRSAFNAVAVNTQEMLNSTMNLGDALAKAPGMKLRESGGVGSDVQLMLDGFTGKHVKVFIDGVPQEGTGQAFGLNNIPAGYAERIEVYKGVVPVGFGSDALGGVVNIVTRNRKARHHLDASYSFGSYNTHRTSVNMGQQFANGLTYEIDAFQTYSDNDYWVDAPVKNFETGSFNERNKQRVRRFNDAYSSVTVIGRVGMMDRAWADKLMLSFGASHAYKEIQTGVRQKVVYGQKHRRMRQLMPRVEYSKRDLLTDGLDVIMTVGYDDNRTTNIDTSAYEYNWKGEKHRLNSPGEQSLQHAQMDNHNWNGTLTIAYRLSDAHTLTANHVWTSMSRQTTSMLANQPQTDAIGKRTSKNITGLQYRMMLSEKWNASVFAKHYHQQVTGPIATDANGTDMAKVSQKISDVGYGIAATWFALDGLQLKASYEHALRLPTIEEMFGDEDLESGDVGIRPEKSHNTNVSLSYSRQMHHHSLYAEVGLVSRDTRDYIQRNVVSLSGGKEAAAYTNYGSVSTRGYNLSVRYGLGRWLSMGGTMTEMDLRDDEPHQIGSIGTQTANLGYRQRIPNVPYRFADFDAQLTVHDAFGKADALTLGYDGRYVHSFSYYSQAIGRTSDYVVPQQVSHNVTVGYSIGGGRYNLTIEGKNITDARLYDNFSLQRAGRGFYAKVRVAL